MAYFPQKTFTVSITLIFTKKGLVKYKHETALTIVYGCSWSHACSECLYFIYSWLTLFLQSLEKDCHSVNLVELSNPGNPSASGTNKE